MLRLTLGTFNTANTPMQSPTAPRFGGGVVDAPPGAVTNPYGGILLHPQGGVITNPGTTVVVTDPGGGSMPQTSVVIPTMPGPVRVTPPPPQTTPGVIVDPNPNPPPAGSQITVVGQPMPSLFSSISAVLTPTRIFAAALAIGAAAIGAVAVSRIRRRGGVSVD